MAQRTDLVTYLLALTDARVKDESAPFDHPSLVIHNGHNANNANNGIDINTDIPVPAVGALGRAAQNLRAIVPFLNVNHQNP